MNAVRHGKFEARDNMNRENDSKETGFLLVPPALVRLFLLQNPYASLLNLYILYIINDFGQ